MVRELIKDCYFIACLKNLIHSQTLTQTLITELELTATTR